MQVWNKASYLLKGKVKGRLIQCMYSSLTTWMIDKSTIGYIFLNCPGHMALLNIGENTRERIKLLKIG